MYLISNSFNTFFTFFLAYIEHMLANQTEYWKQDKFTK